MSLQNVVGKLDPKNRENKESLVQLIRDHGPHILEWANSDFMNTKDVILAAVKQNGEMIHKASAALKNDRDVILAAVKSNGTLLNELDRKWHHDPEIALAALENSPQEFIENDEILTAAARIDSKAVEKIIKQIHPEKKRRSA